MISLGPLGICFFIFMACRLCPAAGAAAEEEEEEEENSTTKCSDGI
jgi:hypothetical protein